jgi:(p)ppGpp synthase/HD superfamily hydrolase
MSTLVNLAKALAFHYHKDQKYGNYSYSKHLEDVVMNVKLLTDGTDLELIVAYLHDIYEDTDVDTDVIPALFGEEVFNACCALTKPIAWKMEYDVYIKKVASNPIALRVKYCDTLANLSQSISDGNIGRITKYTKQLDLLVSYMGTENEPRQSS